MYVQRELRWLRREKNEKKTFFFFNCQESRGVCVHVDSFTTVLRAVCL